MSKPVQAGVLRANRTEAAVALARSLSTALPSSRWRTRFAPAPTGFLHLGHVVSALHVWGIARAHDGEVLLRVEDHDQQRCRAEYERALLDDLDWLGFKPAIGSTETFRHGITPFRQSDNAVRYEQVLRELEQRDLVYACVCSRRMIGEALAHDAPAHDAAAHHASSELRYPGTCREARIDPLSTPARRVRFNSANQAFTDLRLGAQLQCAATQCGDMLLRDRRGQFTYQFAVVVDDLDQDVDVIIRGEDLLQSTGRQLQLGHMIGRAKPLVFLHHALVLRADGVKLSKSLGDTSVREMRAAGMSAENVIGRAAFAAGLLTEPAAISQENLSDLFR